MHLTYSNDQRRLDFAGRVFPAACRLSTRLPEMIENEQLAVREWRRLDSGSSGPTMRRFPAAPAIAIRIRWFPRIAPIASNSRRHVARRMAGGPSADAFTTQPSPIRATHSSDVAINRPTARGLRSSPTALAGDGKA
jgi:hypothetical protein